MKPPSLVSRAALVLTAAVTAAPAFGQCCGGARASVNQPRIVGGSNAPQGAYPWMTALVERGQTPQAGQFCGGALIAPQWVLTAGHCVEGTTASRLDVIVGAYDLRSANGGGQRVQVTQIISHPAYGEVNGTLVNDVALLKLAAPVTGVAVIPLVDSTARIADGSACRGMGFGAVSEGGATSPVLLQVDLSVISLASANSVYGGLTSVHLAAGIPAGGRDTCQGDSGGPLVVANPAGGWMHAGVVSFGDGCARAGVPGIYASTLTFAPWIRQQTGAVTPPPVPADDFGNTVAAAATAVPGTAIAGKLEAAGDIDVFKVTVGGAGTLSASSTGGTAVTGQWLNASGTVLASQTGAPGFTVSTPVTAAGTWYLAVKGAAAATTGAYSTTIAFTAAPATGAPEMDLLGKDGSVITDGTTAATAAAGTAFGSVTAGSSAANTFTIRNSGTATLNVGALQISGAGAAMFRVSAAPPATVSAGRTAAFTLTYAPAAAGTHTADVSIASSDANENPYNFHVTGTAAAAPAGDDHGNTIATATSAVIPFSRACRLEKSGDADCFKFTLTASAAVTLRTTGSIDTYGTLYNAAGSVLTESDDYNSDLNFRIRRTLAAGTYYLAVEGYDSSVTGSYSVVISKQ